MKRCNVCGRENDDRAKFCTGCGGPLANAAPESVPEPVYKSGVNAIGNDGASSDEPSICVDPVYTDKFDDGHDINIEDPPRKHNTILILVVVLVVLLLILAGLLIYTMWFVPKQGANSDQQEIAQSDVQEDDTTSSEADENTWERSDEENTETDTEPEDLSSFPGVDPSNDPEYSHALDPYSYHRVETSDGRFSFYYPDGFFSQVTQDGDNYTFDTKDHSAVLYIRTESVSRSPADSVQAAHDNHLNQLDRATINVDISSEEKDDGWAHAVLSGKDRGNSLKMDYYIAVSDGKKCYTLEYNYTDSQGGAVLSPASYMVDCLYRYCEHSGTTYQVRTYEMYMRDDMGEKK